MCLRLRLHQLCSELSLVLRRRSRPSVPAFAEAVGPLVPVELDKAGRTAGAAGAAPGAIANAEVVFEAALGGEVALPVEKAAPLLPLLLPLLLQALARSIDLRTAMRSTSSFFSLASLLPNVALRLLMFKATRRRRQRRRHRSCAHRGRGKRRRWSRGWICGIRGWHRRWSKRGPRSGCGGVKR